MEEYSQENKVSVPNFSVVKSLVCSNLILILFLIIPKLDF